MTAASDFVVNYTTFEADTTTTRDSSREFVMTNVGRDNVRYIDNNNVAPDVCELHFKKSKTQPNINALLYGNHRLHLFIHDKRYHPSMEEGKNLVQSMTANITITVPAAADDGDVADFLGLIGDLLGKHGRITLLTKQNILSIVDS